jgi:hypothetical protein
MVKFYRQCAKRRQGVNLRHDMVMTLISSYFTEFDLELPRYGLTIPRECSYASSVERLISSA